MKKYKSIKTKILTITILSLALMALGLGLASSYAVNRLSKENSRQLISKICDENALEFESKLNVVYHSVNIIYKYAEGLAKTGEYDVYSDEYLNHVTNLALSVSEETEGAMAVYFRYNPEIVGDGTSGFFWSRGPKDKRFSYEPPTDILAFDPDDISRVGWFYTPKQSGKPLWMSPYYNENIDVFMLSYIIPFYLDSGEFVGVIGMDIDFDIVMQATENGGIYESGRVSLIDTSEENVYYLNDKKQTEREELSPDLYEHISDIGNDRELFRMTDKNGSTSLSCGLKLENGMWMCVSVPEKEIYANRRELMAYMMLLAVLVSVAAGCIIWKNTDRVITPIKNLVDITHRYARGEWGERYMADTNDELMQLSESISLMADQTKEYMDRLSGLARTDRLTGVKNSTSYKEYTDLITNNSDGRYDKYAIAVMDINLLKKANDTYGHEAGDKLICEASRYICRTFMHSPVFRIGGDEFAAILTGEDYDNLEALKSQFESGLGYTLQGYPDIPVSVAIGIALSPEDGSDCTEIFKVADSRMYVMKKNMKAALNI